MREKTKILIVEHEANDIELILHELKKGEIDFVSEIVETQKSYVKALETFKPDVILSDYALPSFNGDEVFEIRERVAPLTPFIFVSGSIGEEQSIEYIKNGVTDYVLKDKLFSLGIKVKRALREAKERDQKNNIKIALEQSERRLAKAQQVAQIGNWETDLSSLHVTWSEETYRIFDIDPKNFGSAHADFLNHVHPEDRVKVDTAFKESLDKTTTAILEHRIVTPNGVLKYVEERWQIIFDKNGLPATAVGTCQDISIRRKSEEKLMQSENRFRRLIEASADLMLLCSIEGKIMYGSPSISTSLGYVPAEIVGTFVFDIIHPDDLPDFAEERKAILKYPGQSFNKQLIIKHKNGEWIWHESTINNMLEEPGIHALVGNFRNISERKKADEAIIASEEEIRDMAESMPQIVWVTTKDGKNTYFNHQWMDYTGLTLEESNGDGWLIPFHDEDKPQAWAAWNNAMNSKSEYIVECRLRKHDGSYRWWLIKGVPKLNEKGEILKWYGTCTDIEKLKEAEREIKKSEKFTHGVLNSLSKHIAVLDREGKIIAVNDSWNRFALENGETTLQRTGEGTNYFDVCKRSIQRGDELAGAALAGILNVMNEKESSFYFEYPCHSATTKRWFGMRVIKFVSDESMVVVSHLNITERKLAEENLLKSEARLKEAQALAHISNWDIDLTLNVHTWSDELYNIFELNKDEIIPSAESFLSVMHPDDRLFAQVKMEEAFTTLKSSSFNFRFILRNGTLRYGYTDWRFEFDAANKPIRIYGILQDVTERKIAEQERERITNDLLERNKDLEQFTYIVSHNLRSPVANILGTTEALRTLKLEEEEREEMIFNLSTSVIKLNTVIEDLNQILKTKRNITEARETASLSHIIKNIRIGLSEQIKKDEVDIKTDFTAIDKLETLKSYLYSIFFNLISNSIKYRQPNVPPVIEIKSYKTDEGMEIHFQDNGLGIDLQQKGDKVFGLYKRFHDHVEGKGMGLFMVKTQVVTLGGKIRIESEVNKGTKFIIQFPS